MKTTLQTLLVCWLLSCSTIVAVEPNVAPTKVRFFESRIRPVLVKHCYKCHSGSAKEVKGGLRLDFRGGLLKGGDSGAAISLGKPQKSLLLQALMYAGPKMPPSGPLDKTVVADFYKWIADGAVDPRAQPMVRPVGAAATGKSGQNHWAFQPLAQPEVPKDGEGWARNAIDQFIATRHADAGVNPSPESAPGTLLRRLHLGLTGLPPIPAEVIDVTGDYNDAAYEAAVDRLLDSPHFGPHWASMWLDVARFAESSGFEMDHDRPEAWRYREFVIRAMNDDLPYDEFVQLQLAGDHLRPDDIDAITATGFVVAGVRNLIQSRKEFIRDRYDKLDDMVSTVSTGLLGLTVGCARCHDHKFDPISQRDYYHVAAAFASTLSQVRELKRDDLTVKLFSAGEAPDNRIEMVTVTERSKDWPSIPAVVHFLPRGNSANPQEAMTVGFPSVLPGGRTPTKWAAERVPGRLALARWITDVQEGAGQLLARVIVNRLWTRHFGQGLVATPSDFGTRGGSPTHPQLLDWLAGELIRNGWRLKPLHKLIVMSATYRQGYGASDDRQTAQNAQLDPTNQLRWRRQPQRLHAEAIRDNLLAVSGQLDLNGITVGSLDENARNRSIYLRVKRSRLQPLFQLFDAPDALQGIGQRQTTTTAPQGLMLLNHPLVNQCAEAFAARLTAENPTDTRTLVDRGFLWSLGRPASEDEVEVCSEILKSGTAEATRDFCQMLLCLNEFIYVE
ncbi:MAG: PSD1 and planctomycete cytochrome C domain-containing protein [Planctomycetota bacterium]|nr:PSD1 and planctomycete cytochrome C domain-containing protein [Planctomycetota bacterium]